MKYIIVQAGGKGTRLEYLTENKPKALVPVRNQPMLFHLFKKYPEAYYIIIADYKREVMHEYLESFADVKYQVVDSSGTGTCGGIGQALRLIPDNAAFALIWSDLVLPKQYNFPDEYDSEKIPDKNYIGISQTFPCRWSYENGTFIEKRSSDHGIAGLFLFKDKNQIAGVPKSGELVRWLSGQNISFEETGLAGTSEFGLLEELNKLGTDKTRPFNKISFDGDIVIKEPLDEQGKSLDRRECAWYKKAKELKCPILPEIYGLNPLRMERIHGLNIYEAHLSHDDKSKVLAKLISALKDLHDSSHIAGDSFSMYEAYYGKTMKRLSKIRDLVPFAHDEYVTVNGRRCRNVFFYKRKLEDRLQQLHCDTFEFIHGDATFSNLMIRDNGDPVLIDPRGYFGYTELYGDARYDWAKLYYSIVGNYDMFNLKKFRLHLSEKDVCLRIESNGWEDMEEEFFELSGAEPYEIKLLHSVIWLSLTTYAWQDYDSVCGAFYNGLYYLEEVL